MAKFNLNNNLENEFFKESFKFCKSCGCQTNLNAKFCIECGSKEFFNTLREYKLNKELYCVKCLSKKGKNNKCPYCGNDKFLNGDLAFYEMSRNYIDDLNKKSVVLESEVINLRKEYENITSKIKKASANLKKCNKDILNLSNDDDNEYNEKINHLNQEISKYDNLIQQQKETNKSMLQMISKTKENKENEDNAFKELEANYLLLIDEIDELEKELNKLYEKKDNYKFRIELINNSKGKNKKLYQMELDNFSYGNYKKLEKNTSLNDLPNDPRALFILGKMELDKDNIDVEEYLRLNLKGFYQLMNNVSNKSGKTNGVDCFVLALLYDGEYNYVLSKYLNEDKEKIASYYESALDLGIEEAREKLEYIKKKR